MPKVEVATVLEANGRYLDSLLASFWLELALYGSLKREAIGANSGPIGFGWAWAQGERRDVLNSLTGSGCRLAVCTLGSVMGQRFSFAFRGDSDRCL